MTTQSIVERCNRHSPRKLHTATDGRRLTVFGPGTGLRGGRKPRFEVEGSTEWPKVWKVWNLGMIEDLRKCRN
jgi:hypothetical protein